MAASHVAVETGGKSSPRFRIPVPASGSGMASRVASGMGTLLHYFKQIAERGGFGTLGVHEKDGGSPRALARRFVDDLEAVGLQVIERLLDVGHAQRDVRHPAAAAVLLDLFRNRRFVRQRLQQ